MLRTILFAVAIALAAGSIPVTAKAANNCQSWCLQNRCAHGSPNQQLCMQACVPACKKKHQKGKR